MENGFFTVDYESMAGVVTTLVAHNIFSPFSQEIDDLPFTFVTPIGCPVRRRCYPFFKITVCLKWILPSLFQSYSTFCIQNKANPTTF